MRRCEIVPLCRPKTAVQRIGDHYDRGHDRSGLRLLDEVTEETLTQMVERLVSDRINDHQFDQCPLSFEELLLVKKAIIKTLAVTSHIRIKYPKKPS